MPTVELPLLFKNAEQVAYVTVNSIKYKKRVTITLEHNPHCITFGRIEKILMCRKLQIKIQKSDFILIVRVHKTGHFDDFLQSYAINETDTFKIVPLNYIKNYDCFTCVKMSDGNLYEIGRAHV